MKMCKAPLVMLLGAVLFSGALASEAQANPSFHVTATMNTPLNGDVYFIPTGSINRSVNFLASFRFTISAANANQVFNVSAVQEILTGLQPNDPTGLQAEWDNGAGSNVTCDAMGAYDSGTVQLGNSATLTQGLYDCKAYFSVIDNNDPSNMDSATTAVNNYQVKF